MCDEHTMPEHEQRSELSRRRLGAVAAGAGLAAALPRAANALEVKESNVVIKTPDGEAEAHFAHPVSGKHPAVLVWPDAVGLRPAFKAMGKRLAEAGYAVLTPNPYYRSTKVPATAPNFGNQADRDQIFKWMGTLSPETHFTDAKAFISYIDTQSAVDTGKKIGTTGYCMGGPMTMRTAAERADRVGAAASFHGGGLVTQAPTSPHLLIPKMKVSYLFAIADDDDKKQPDAKTVLKEEFAKAKLKAEIEVYPAPHGWCPPDMPMYNQAESERAWGRLLNLFKTALV